MAAEKLISEFASGGFPCLGHPYLHARGLAACPASRPLRRPAGLCPRSLLPSRHLLDAISSQSEGESPCPAPQRLPLEANLCAETAKFTLYHQVSWGCPLSSRSLRAPGAAPCPHAWGGLRDARQPGERVRGAGAGGCGRGRRAGSAVQATWEGGRLDTFRAACRTCGRVRTQRGELCRPAARSAPGRGVRSVRGLYQAVGKAAEGGMLVGEVALNSCSCTVWVGAAGRGARYQSVLPLP